MINAKVMNLIKTVKSANRNIYLPAFYGLLYKKQTKAIYYRYYLIYEVPFKCQSCFEIIIKCWCSVWSLKQKNNRTDRALSVGTLSSKFANH